MNCSSALNIFRRSTRLSQRNFFTHPQYKHLMEPFSATYPHLKKLLVENVEGEGPKRVIGEMLDYIMDSGRFLRAAITLKVHEVMKLPHPEPEPKTMHTAHAMAWISELVQIPAIIEDDIADNSSLRRGKAPYHVGRSLVHCLVVSRWLTASPHLLLNDWMGEYPFFKSASKVLTECSLISSNLQLIESAVHESELINLLRSKNIPWEYYKHYSTYNSYYCTVLPFRLAAYAARRSELPFNDEIHDILKDIAQLLKLYNDGVALAIGGAAPPGKDLDEDIKEKKFTFTLTYLMNTATDEDKDFIVNNYGDVETTRKLMEKYKIAEGFEQYRNDLSKSINTKIERVSNEHKLQDGLIAVHDTVNQFLSRKVSKIKVDF
ncbi:uncharacterized protein LOC135846083 [Planococcus citri]|uniref:uncharacterized protein LOC135844733 n=1 Tax=Planococcus citri TaxID=170843 RepID=UPI0031F7B052